MAVSTLQTSDTYHKCAVPWLTCTYVDAAAHLLSGLARMTACQHGDDVVMQVKAEEQAAIVLAAQALAQAEAQAELHKQLQQRLTDAQAASVQEAEREKRKVQSVTLKGARLAFNAPKAAGKAPATTPTGAITAQRPFATALLVIYSIHSCPESCLKASEHRQAAVDHDTAYKSTGIGRD